MKNFVGFILLYFFYFFLKNRVDFQYAWSYNINIARAKAHKQAHNAGGIDMVLKVFLGMEIGRYDGYEFGTVLRTFDNGYKLVFMEGFADEYGSWDSLWIAKPDDRFGWYGVDDLNVRTETGSHRNGWLERELRFK